MKRALLPLLVATVTLASCDAVNNADNPSNSAPPPESNEPQTSEATLRDAGSMMDDTASAAASAQPGDTIVR